VSGSSQARLALIGMPRTGKSTYLGTLWSLVQSPLETSVREADRSGDRSYIQRLAVRVARAEELDRTSIDMDDAMAVELAFESFGTAELVIPDTSGEALRTLVEDRAWLPRLASACQEATAIAIFVHPERLRVPQRRALLAVAGENLGVEPEEPESVVSFDPREHASTAAELIDAFENIAELCRERWPIRIALIISAWDLVDGNPTPYEWLQSRLPGLLATLESNPDIAEFEVFGVSAQGGPLAEREQLLARGEICDRVFASDRDGRAVSVVAPVRWAIFGG
jgi:GTPase SAR1 family protein